MSVVGSGRKRSARREMRSFTKSDLLRVSEYSAAKQLAMSQYVRRSRLLRDVVILLLGFLSGLFAAAAITSWGF
jgi:hypothetical protein